MASIGESFPLSSRQQFVQDHLKSTCVVKVAVRFPEGTKVKFLAIAYEDDEDCLAFVINTEVNPFVAKRPHLNQCQVKIDCATHSFLDHDSYVACHEALALNRRDLVDELVAAPSKLKGNVTDAVREQIVSAVKYARTISEAEKSKILSCLDC